MIATARAQHVRTSSGHNWKRWLSDWWGYGAVGVGAILVRTIALSEHPGYEWDEPVYTSIARNLATTGELVAKTEYYATPEPYLYHPPFYFYLLAGWFELWGSGITQARVLSVLGSLLMLVLLAGLLRRVLGVWGLPVIALLATDAWMVFTNRVSWIENTMMPIGVIGIWLYYEASRRIDKDRFMIGLYVWAGVFIGLVGVYKHLGAYFLLVPLITWLIVRCRHKQHFALIGGYLAVMASYVAGMAIFYTDAFVRQVEVQIDRSLGVRESRGALTTPADIIGPLTSQYLIYWSSIILTALAVGLVLYRSYRLMRKQTMEVGEVILFAWAVSAIVFFAVLQLRIPHYFMLLQVPLYCYLGVEARRFFGAARSRRKRWLLIGVVTVLAVANALALTVRLEIRDGNPLQDVDTWTQMNLPPDARVVTEESVGTMISQPYCKMAFTRFCVDTAEYIITYTSATQQVPDIGSVQYLLERGTPLVSFQGFKETITVYEIE